MTTEDLRARCRQIMLQLDTHDENAAMNAGDRLAALLAELIEEMAKDARNKPGG